MGIKLFKVFEDRFLPNATETPAAAEALRISRFLASLFPYLGKIYENMFPIQHAR